VTPPLWWQGTRVMAAFFAFLGMLLLSLVACFIAGLQLGDHFGANDEFPLILGYLAVFTTSTLCIFAICYRLVRSARAINLLAFLLAMLALLPPVIPGFVAAIAEHSTNPYSIGTEQTYIKLELIVPAMLAVLVQWGLIRRRWLRVMGEEELTSWPWVSTVVAAIVILNPVGLAFLTDSIGHSPTELLWQLFAISTVIVLVVLLVAASVECYIRDKILRRRLASGSPNLSQAARLD